MDLYEVIARRRMVRNFEDRPVPPPVIDRILRHAVRGPSAGFTQGFDFLVLDDHAALERFWELTSDAEWRESDHRRTTIRRAPVIVVPLADKSAYLSRYSEADKAASGLGDEARWPVPYWTIDAAMATMLLLLAAVEEGLGALFFGLFRGSDAAMSAFGVPAELQPLGAVALGYPAPDQPSPSLRRGRRPLPSVVHRNHW